jgi:spore coat protein U-like protein
MERLMKIRTSLKPIALATIALLPTAAMAATTTTTMAVSATVISACIVAATPMAFGNYDPTSATATTSTSVISVTCTSAAPYNVGLDKGANGSSVTARLLKVGANTLPYSLYSDASRTVNWGNTVGTDTVTGTGSGILQNVTVYGRIPAGATVPAGAYTDTVTVTVTY